MAGGGDGLVRLSPSDPVQMKAGWRRMARMSFAISRRISGVVKKS